MIAYYGSSSSSSLDYQSGAAIVFNVATGARTAVLLPTLHRNTRDVR